MFYAIILAIVAVAAAAFKGFSFAAKKSDIAAGKEENQSEAMANEINRITRAADAAGRVPVGQPDPNDRDKK